MSRPRVRPAAAAALACGLLAVGTGVAGLIVAGHTGRGPLLPGRPTAIPAPAGRTAAPVPANTSAQAAARRAVARPVALVIPAIGLHTRLIRLGVTRTGGLQVPSTTKVAGWYAGGPRPGAIGPAVIAGHIDSYRGPGVFFRLRQLRLRDRIYVRRSDGPLAVFKVTSVRTYPKDHFPTASVYGPVPGAQLRLITCGGRFDPSLRSYLSNVVVYAVAASRPRRIRRTGAAPGRTAAGR
jgi:Sortase domain